MRAPLCGFSAWCSTSQFHWPCTHLCYSIIYSPLSWPLTNLSLKFCASRASSFSPFGRWVSTPHFNCCLVLLLECWKRDVSKFGQKICPKIIMYMRVFLCCWYMHFAYQMILGKKTRSIRWKLYLYIIWEAMWSKLHYIFIFSQIPQHTCNKNMFPMRDALHI